SDLKTDDATPNGKDETKPVKDTPSRKGRVARSKSPRGGKRTRSKSPKKTRRSRSRSRPPPETEKPATTIGTKLTTLSEGTAEDKNTTSDVVTIKGATDVPSKGSVSGTVSKGPVTDTPSTSPVLEGNKGQVPIDMTIDPVNTTTKPVEPKVADSKTAEVTSSDPKTNGEPTKSSSVLLEKTFEGSMDEFQVAFNTRLHELEITAHCKRPEHVLQAVQDVLVKWYLPYMEERCRFLVEPSSLTQNRQDRSLPSWSSVSVDQVLKSTRYIQSLFLLCKELAKLPTQHNEQEMKKWVAILSEDASDPQRTILNGTMQLRHQRSFPKMTRSGSQYSSPDQLDSFSFRPSMQGTKTPLLQKNGGFS